MEKLKEGQIFIAHRDCMLKTIQGFEVKFKKDSRLIFYDVNCNNDVFMYGKGKDKKIELNYWLLKRKDLQNNFDAITDHRKVWKLINLK